MKRQPDVSEASWRVSGGEHQEPSATPEAAPPISEEELATLTALTALDAAIRQAAPHLAGTPGSGLVSFLRELVAKQTGTAL